MTWSSIHKIEERHPKALDSHNDWAQDVWFQALGIDFSSAIETRTILWKIGYIMVIILSTFVY